MKRAREDAEGDDAAAAGGNDGTMVGRHRGEVRGLAVDALSRTVVSASLDRTLRFWRRVRALRPSVAWLRSFLARPEEARRTHDAWRAHAMGA